LLLSVLAESIYKRNLVMQNEHNYARAYSVDQKGNIFFVIITAVALSLFSGLRTFHNDTFNYINSFRLRVPDSLTAIDFNNLSVNDGSGFFIYQVLIKNYISIDPQVFLLISAVITNVIICIFLS
jgi:hypothetical protein